ncbi:cysteine desulfurase [Olivibacter sp. SDN3]|uniref:cysteine desulfurase family protein n=1 Tax=Olivibacter sp. SDN3 TaxID=2764720 RepID=UPI0016512C17|nr:cysteine desulfurase family protein [Olivibacter sp. SDN3]QNL50163.1 cysteine desulfurase [Olivibacter sp. SDN3]
MSVTPIYLDYNATTPCDQRVVDVMLPYFTSQFGNASSGDHSFGWMAKEAVEQAREQIANLIHVSPKQLIFTSGATEAVNLALKGIAEACISKGNHLITSKVEHQAVLDTCAYLETKGFIVTYLDVDANGRIALNQLKEAINTKTICIALMYANNETGIINPVKQIGALARRHGVYFMCDATQAVGKIPVDVEQDFIDLMAFSAHKMYGPKGVGALFVRNVNPKVEILQQQHGGGHEKGYRSGTLNTAGIVGFGKAAAICQEEMQEDSRRLLKLREEMEVILLQEIQEAFINGKGEKLPQTCNISFPGIDSEQLLLTISKDVALSRGSACSGIVQRPSHVLQAMGLKPTAAHNAIRISLGRQTSEQEIKLATATLIAAVRQFTVKSEQVF